MTVKRPGDQLEKVEDKKAKPEFPDHLRCPITGKAFFQPIAIGAYTYELVELLRQGYGQSHVGLPHPPNVCPMTDLYRCVKPITESESALPSPAQGWACKPNQKMQQMIDVYTKESLQHRIAYLECVYLPPTVGIIAALCKNDLQHYWDIFIAQCQHLSDAPLTPLPRKDTGDTIAHFAMQCQNMDALVVLYERVRIHLLSLNNDHRSIAHTAAAGGWVEGLQFILDHPDLQHLLHVKDLAGSTIRQVAHTAKQQAVVDWIDKQPSLSELTKASLSPPLTNHGIFSPAAGSVAVVARAAGPAMGAVVAPENTVVTQAPPPPPLVRRPSVNHGRERPSLS